jgi:hypothetical protein
MDLVVAWHMTLQTSYVDRRFSGVSNTSHFQ